MLPQMTSGRLIAGIGEAEMTTMISIIKTGTPIPCRGEEERKRSCLDLTTTWMDKSGADVAGCGLNELREEAGRRRRERWRAYWWSTAR